MRFDHDRSEFPLRGRHFTTPCLACHKNNLFTGLRTECVTCHARDRPNTLDHPKRWDCNAAGCHTPFSWHDRSGAPSSAGRIAAWTLGILTALNFLNYVDRYVLAAVLVKMKLDPVFASVDQAQLGLLQTAFLWVYMCASPPAGLLGRRVPRKYLVAAGVGIWSLATIASGLVQSYGQMVWARAIIGFGEAGYAVVAPAMISDLYAPIAATACSRSSTSPRRSARRWASSSAAWSRSTGLALGLLRRRRPRHAVRAGRAPPPRAGARRPGGGPTLPPGCRCAKGCARSPAPPSSTSPSA